jgi:catechol 2,3-dioxygenase-like lactoylglutathione lyase family enzyme
VSPDSIDTITLFVEDVALSKRFYEDLFGLSVIFEDDNSAVFRFENTLINLVDASAATAVKEPAVVAGPGTGSRFLLTINVPDVDAVCADLQARGVELLSGPIGRPWGVRTVAFADSAGHVWEIAQRLPE